MARAASLTESAPGDRGASGIMPAVVAPAGSTQSESEVASRPDVSVVIPTRNRWAKLMRLGLRAALSQREVEVEVILIDDGL